MALSPTDPLSYTVRLVAVKQAINEVVSGVQSTSYEGRSMTMADLDSLVKLEAYYERQAAIEAAAALGCVGRSRITYVIPVT